MKLTVSLSVVCFLVLTVGDSAFQTPGIFAVFSRPSLQVRVGGSCLPRSFESALSITTESIDSLTDLNQTKLLFKSVVEAKDQAFDQAIKANQEFDQAIKAKDQAFDQAIEAKVAFIKASDQAIARAEQLEKDLKKAEIDLGNLEAKFAATAYLRPKFEELLWDRVYDERGGRRKVGFQKAFNDLVGEEMDQGLWKAIQKVGKAYKQEISRNDILTETKSAYDKLSEKVHYSVPANARAEGWVINDSPRFAVMMGGFFAHKRIPRTEIWNPNFTKCLVYIIDGDVCTVEEYKEKY